MRKGQWNVGAASLGWWDGAEVEEPVEEGKLCQIVFQLYAANEQRWERL